MNIVKIITAIFIGSIAWSCGTPNKNNKHAAIIDLTQGVDHIGMMPLSEVATGIEYIPLETSDEALVGNIQALFFHNDHIFIKDNTGLIKVFDRNGAFVRTINRVGRGPQEYLQNSSLSLSPSNGNLLLADNATIKEYDPFGQYIREVGVPRIDDYLTARPMMISENRFVAPLANPKYDREFCVIIFDSLSNVQQLIPTPDLFGTEQQQIINQGSGDVIQFVQMIQPTIFQYGSGSRFFYPSTTEIFTTDGYGVIDTAYTIEYGKYQLPGGVLTDYLQSGKYLLPLSFIESESHLFMNASIRNILDDSSIFLGNFVFNKRTMETRLLHNHATKMNGFIDDMQEGPPFWPRTISGKNTLVSYAYPIDLNEHSKHNGAFKNTLSILTDDSNPVVIFVHLKEGGFD